MTRELTAEESQVFKFLRINERFIKEWRLSATVHMKPKALDTVVRLGIAKPLKTDFNKDAGLYYVTFLMSEFQSYLRFCCRQVGFTVQLDGSIKTVDNLTLEMSELN